jgi:hypothetical protein
MGAGFFLLHPVTRHEIRSWPGKAASQGTCPSDVSRPQRASAAKAHGKVEPRTERSLGLDHSAPVRPPVAALDTGCRPVHRVRSPRIPVSKSSPWCPAPLRTCRWCPAQWCRRPCPAEFNAGGPATTVTRHVNCARQPVNRAALERLVIGAALDQTVDAGISPAEPALETQQAASLHPRCADPDTNLQLFLLPL